VWGRKLLQAATTIVATAEQERDELVAGGLDPSNIVIRRNGVEAPKQLPQRGEFRRRLAIAENAQLILFLGRLSQKKSPDLLLRAFANLPGEASAQLAFVGPDASGMRAKLQELARATGVAQSVHFIGPLDGQAKWAAYQDADVFVLPSQNENFGNTAAEAVAAGTPVVVTDRCGIAPFLKDVAGLVVTHDDKPLAGALTQLLRDQNLYARLRDGCAKATAALGWDEPVHQMEVIYRRLVQRRPS